ncbi:MAG: diguanylate cyclase [Gaiellales bacterium]
MPAERLRNVVFDETNPTPGEEIRRLLAATTGPEVRPKAHERLAERIRGTSLRSKLFAIAVVGVLMSAWNAAAAFTGFAEVQSTDGAQADVAAVQQAQQDADMRHDAINATVNAALLAARGVPGYVLTDVARTLDDEVSVMRDDLLAVSEYQLGRELDESARAYRRAADPYLESAGSIIEHALANRRDTVDEIDTFRRQFGKLERFGELWTAQLIERREALAAKARADRRRAQWQIVAALMSSIILLLLVSYAIGRSVVLQLRALREVASQVVAGDLSARQQVRSGDEIGGLGRAFNQMADSLTSLVTRLEFEVLRDRFGNQLTQAFETADQESEAIEVVARAMAEIDPARPMELLLADSSRAHLSRAAESPTAGAPGCPVTSPFSCVAVRRGSAVRFADSESLEACPRLRGRDHGSISAACVPVTFMGRALGVIHASGPAGDPFTSDQVEQLSTLATQAGARIGTVRAFETVQLQASTDGLTGLINRRALEARLRELATAGTPFAFVIADLDRFKLLNDTHGHEAGDHALRLFSQVLRDTLRTSDLIARLGGEEFALALVGIDEELGVTMIGRIRERLADAVKTYGGPPFTFSAGLTDSRHAVGFAELLRRADAALYAAKNGGRDCAMVADDEIVARAAHRKQKTSTAVAAVETDAPVIHQTYVDDPPRPSGAEIR